MSGHGGNGSSGSSSSSGSSTGGGSPLYTVKWPKSAAHCTKSVSGVLVESNVRGQLALHFYNEVRELEPKIEYMEDGKRAASARPVTYVREISDSILLSASTARQLRDVLAEFLSVSSEE